MNPSLQRLALRVMSGEARGIAPTMLRGALRAAEPIYAAAMTGRNRLYDAGIFKVHRLPQRVVSVGNLTAGGTGKTPVVRWLAEHLVSRGWRPAVLLRGYRAPGATFSDEQALLQAYLDGLPVIANADRCAGAALALEQRPQTNVLLLDDAFQHRRVARDVDLVLISAAEPFGFGHVHPRGLLREPLRGLERAHAVILTRCNEVEAADLHRVEGIVRSISATIPVVRAVHEMIGLRRAATALREPVDEPIEALRGRKFFAFAGIGNPATFHSQLIRAGGIPAGSRWFADHHDYGDADLAELAAAATAAGADMLLTTEKDWVKLSRLTPSRTSSPPILRVEVRIGFERREDETHLLDLVERMMSSER